MKHRPRALALALGSAIAAASIGQVAVGSSHREAPLITESPKVDGTDFYMFQSYEPGREGYTTLIANYQPLQDAYGGPNYFTLDPDAVYAIHIDNDGDAVEDLTFEFRFKNEIQDIALNVGGESVSVPLINIGPIGPNADDTANLNVLESYKVRVIRSDRKRGRGARIRNATTGSVVFAKPADNIGNKSIVDYATYAAQHIYDINIPYCGVGRMFVGQRAEGFVVNLGEIFDLINTNPLGPVDGEANTIGNKNITSLALEVPTDCLVAGGEPVIGGWTTASLPRKDKDKDEDDEKHGKGKRFKQVSRLGSPLVNEIVIGVKDKDEFNASKPKDDAQFATYVTNPTLPAIIEVLFPVQAPTAFPRTDLVAIFLTGLAGLNQPASVRPAEMLRLNTAIPPAPAASQASLGVLQGDNAGYPNGRRPGDDVVDIALRAVMGVLLDTTVAPSGQLPFTDGAFVDAGMFATDFPYLNTPLPGSPN